MSAKPILMQFLCHTTIANTVVAQSRQPSVLASFGCLQCCKTPGKRNKVHTTFGQRLHSSHECRECVTRDMIQPPSSIELEKAAD